MFAETPDTFLADFGVSATWTGQPWTFDGIAITFDSTVVTFDATTHIETSTVLFEQPDGNVLANRVQTRGYKITYRGTHFANMTNGDAIACNGMFFTVLQTSSIDDGTFFEAALERM